MHIAQFEAFRADQGGQLVTVRAPGGAQIVFDLREPAEFDEPMIALQAASTQATGWENFVIDLADFAEQWGGVPLYSQSRSVRADYARQVYGARLDYFRNIRRQLDPEDRLMTPFMAAFSPLVPEASSGRRGLLSQTSTPWTRCRPTRMS